MKIYTDYGWGLFFCTMIISPTVDVIILLEIYIIKSRYSERCMKNVLKYLL